MAEIDPDLIKMYQCINWNTGTHGGVINTSVEIDSGATNGIFADVSDSYRLAGTTDYRKVFIRNENAETYTTVKCWISANTPSTDDAVWICLGTTNDVVTTASTYDYYQPDGKTHIDVLEAGNLVEDDSFSLWIKRVVGVGSSGYNNNTFEIKVENS